MSRFPSTYTEPIQIMQNIYYFQEQINDTLESEVFDEHSKVSILANLKSQVNSSQELIDDEKLQIESLIESHLIVLLRDQLGNIQANNGVQAKELPSDYGDLASSSIKSKKGVTMFNTAGQPFGQWFCKTYLPKFHPMPSPEIQYPILTSVALMNPNAVLINEDKEWINKIPFILFLGLRGSGKSMLARQILKLYPKHLRVQTDVSYTGASIRDDLNPVCKRNKPAIMLYDNLHPAESFRALGRHYNLFLQNEKAHCVSKISCGGEDTTESEFHFYCSKIVTTIFDLEYDKDPKSLEILRRFLVFCCERAFPDESFSGYSWSEFEEEFYKIWTNTEVISDIYFPCLLELESMSPKHAKGIDPAMWDLIKMPIATGVMLGIWQNEWEAISAFANYFSVLPVLKKTAVKDLLAQCIQLFISSYYPSWIEMNSAIYPDLSVDVIKAQHLYDYVQGYGIAVRDKERKEIIPQLLSDYGYSSKLSSKELLYVK